jgi:hypothetical protein
MRVWPLAHQPVRVVACKHMSRAQLPRPLALHWIERRITAHPCLLVRCVFAVVLCAVRCGGCSAPKRPLSIDSWVHRLPRNSDCVCGCYVYMVLRLIQQSIRGNRPGNALQLPCHASLKSRFPCGARDFINRAFCTLLSALLVLPVLEL